MPKEADRSPSESTVVYIKLPTDLIQWLDLVLAEKRLELIKAGRELAHIPTRSSFIRDHLQRVRTNSSNGKK